MNPKLLFEKAVTVADKSGFMPGQDEATTVQQLQEYYQPVRYDEATILQIARLVDPTYTITDQDRAQQDARRNLSEQARVNCYRLMHKKFEIDAAGTLERGLNMLFDYTDKPEAKAHNQRVHKAFARDVKNKYIAPIEDRTAIMKEFLDKMGKMDFSSLYSMTDEELAEEFPKMFSAFILGVEGGDGLQKMNGRVFNLDEEYAGKLKQFHEELGCVIPCLKSRFDAIMNPNYELLHIERIVPVPDGNHDPSTVYSDEANPIGALAARNVDSFDSLAMQVNTYIISNTLSYRMLGWQDMVSYFARTKGMDPKEMELVKADGTALPDTNLDGISMIKARDSKTDKEYLLQSNGVSLAEFDPTKALATAQKGGDKIVKALEDADPWTLRLFAGSREYADMKKQMKAVSKAVEGLKKPVSEEKYHEVRAMLDDLAQKSQKYLDNKGTMNDDTKDSERARIMAAKRVREYAENTALLLDADRQLELERQTQRDKNNEEMGKNLDAESRFVRASNPGSVSYSPEPAPTQEMQQQRQEKIRAFYTDRFAYGDNLEMLGTQIVGTLTLPNPHEKALQLMSKMLAYDLILKERAANHNDKNGPLEQQYAASPEKFCQGLEKSGILSDIARTMVEDAGKFQRFVDTAVGNRTMVNEEGGAVVMNLHQLTEMVIIEAGQQAKEEQALQAQQNLENQPKEPELNVPGMN